MNNDSFNSIMSDADIAELAFNEWHHNDKNIKNDFQTGFMAGYKKAKEEYRKLIIDKINERKRIHNN